ncbi:hypothetical protein Cycma_3530 [Cyclobacterium marinum DSM 745]|uniref:Uncharacterized protein n=1 Tax=Cyclobacterium marinum (strain ATCC 25205 / DSM 745 / LMG 13164 / NCIMB 1802) TaxID=880070 RepID=G0IYR7_CYCMS|nr:hypothetical protein Cycma_3530 [Cyclobacterium marinum DSM 745]
MTGLDLKPSYEYINDLNFTHPKSKLKVGVLIFIF